MRVLFLQKESREGGRRQRRPVTPADAVGLPVGDYQRNRKALDEQRHKEYQEYLQQKQVWNLSVCCG